MFSPQYSQPEQQINIHNFTTKTETMSETSAPLVSTNFKVRIGLYLFVVHSYFSILYLFEQVEYN